MLHIDIMYFILGFTSDSQLLRNAAFRLGAIVYYAEGSVVSRNLTLIEIRKSNLFHNVAQVLVEGTGH
jgi:hypothetical protein